MGKYTMQDRLVVALGLALEEIHNPGAGRSCGYDIVDICEALIKEATQTSGVPKMIRAEMTRRAGLPS